MGTSCQKLLLTEFMQPCNLVTCFLNLSIMIINYDDVMINYVMVSVRVDEDVPKVW